MQKRGGLFCRPDRAMEWKIIRGRGEGIGVVDAAKLRFASSGGFGCLRWGVGWIGRWKGQDGSDRLATSARPTEERFASAVAEVKRGDWAEVDEVAAAGAVRATPILKEVFASSEDVDLGNKDNVYPDYLLAQAKVAAESDIPFPFKSDGKEMSPELTAWAAAHHVSVETAVEEAYSGFPGRLAMVDDLNDRRAIPVLRRALLAPDVMIQVAGAAGLAVAGDKDSIPLIVDACSKAPAEAASAIAFMSLVYFDDPRAQGGAAQYLSKEMLQSFEGKKLYMGPMPKRVTPQP